MYRSKVLNTIAKYEAKAARAELVGERSISAHAELRSRSARRDGMTNYEKLHRLQQNGGSRIPQQMRWNIKVSRFAYYKNMTDPEK